MPHREPTEGVCAMTRPIMHWGGRKFLETGIVVPSIVLQGFTPDACMYLVKPAPTEEEPGRVDALFELEITLHSAQNGVTPTLQSAAVIAYEL